MSIYGHCRDTLVSVMNRLVSQIEAYSKTYEEANGERLYEHLRYRVKSEDRMLDKLRRRSLEPTPINALRTLTDAIGLRIVCLFIDDVYENAARIRALPGVRVVQEKDYIQDAKPNGYRSYHTIVRDQHCLCILVHNTRGPVLSRITSVFAYRRRYHPPCRNLRVYSGIVGTLLSFHLSR